MKLLDCPIEQTTIRTDLGAIFVSLELSTVKWVVSSIQPGRQKISKHEVKAGATDGTGDSPLNLTVVPATVHSIDRSAMSRWFTAWVAVLARFSRVTPTM